jgi:hypothetical protein
MGLGGRGVQDRPSETKSTRYRRLAAECLEVAKTVQAEELRVTLTEMAQTWLRLADEKRDD